METYTYNAVELTLTQDPYLDDISYKAHAVDASGNEYIFEWIVKNPECEDESDACDWEDFSVKAI